MVTAVARRIKPSLEDLVLAHDWSTPELQSIAFEGLAVIQNARLHIGEAFVIDKKTKPALQRQMAIIKRARDSDLLRTRIMSTDRDGVFRWKTEHTSRDGEQEEVVISGRMEVLSPSNKWELPQKILGELAQVEKCLVGTFGVSSADIRLVKRLDWRSTWVRRLFGGVSRALVVRVIDNKHVRLWVIIDWW